MYLCHSSPAVTGQIIQCRHLVSYGQQTASFWADSSTAIRTSWLTMDYYKLILWDVYALCLLAMAALPMFRLD